MANNPFGGGGSSGGSGGGNPFGSASSSGGGSSSGQKRRQPNPRRDLIRALARINQIKNPEKRAAAQEVMGKALEGFDGNQITEIGRKAGLTPGDVNAIAGHAAATHVRRTGGEVVPGSPQLAAGLDILDRVTRRPVVRGLVEGQGGRDPVGFVRGTYEGLVEGENNPGGQAVIALATGKSPEETAKIRANLPGPVRTGLDFGGDVVFDWSNWVTLGGGALADNAARTVAKAAVGQAAEDAALSAPARAVYEQLLVRGYKGLTPSQRKVVSKAYPDGKIPMHIRHKVSRASGGMRVAGVPVPGTRALNRRLDRLGVKPGGHMAGIEHDVRVRAGVRQATREGTLPVGAPQDVENILAQGRGAEFMGSLAPKRAQAGPEEILGRTLGGVTRKGNARAAIRAGRKILDQDPGILNRVRNALDVGGGDAAVQALPRGERELAQFLRGMSDEDFAAWQQYGRLHSDDAALEMQREVAGGPFNPKIARAQQVIERIEKKRYKQSGRYANALGRTKVLADEAAVRGEARVAERATEREAALNAREVADQVREVNRKIISDARSAKSAHSAAQDQVRRLERGLDQIDREVRTVTRRAEKALTREERRGYELQLRTLDDERQATTEALARAVGDLEDAKAATLKMERLRHRMRDVTRTRVPGRPGAARPVRQTGPEVAAAKVLSREQTKLRVVENLKKSAEGRLGRLETRKQAAEDAVDIVPQDQYLEHLRIPDSEVSRRARRRVGFLERRTNREPIEGAEGYYQDPRVSMGHHQKITEPEVQRIRGWESLDEASAGAPSPYTIRRGADPDVNGIDEFKAANPGWEADYVETTAPKIYGKGSEPVLIHKQIEPVFNKVTKAMESGRIRRNVEYLNALWARMATGTLGFISRNVLQGNLFMGMVLGEARNPAVWARSLGTMKRMQRGIRQLGDPYAFIKPAERQLVESAIRDNAVESGFLDIIRNQEDMAIAGAGGRTARALKGSRWSPASPKFVGWAPISNANQWAENWSRLSVYINKRAQGMASPEAAAITRRVMLDYRDLAPLNDKLRMVNPFMTWTYKSAPLIMGTLVRDPRKIKIPLAFLNAVNAEGQASEGTGVVPNWQIEAGGVTLPKGIRERLPLGLDTQPQSFLPATPIHTTMEAFQPIADLLPALKGDPGAWQKLMSDAVNVLGAGGVPGGALKSAVEGATGTELFTGRQHVGGERVQTPFPLSSLAGFTPVSKTMPWEVENFLQNLIPVLGRMQTVKPQNDYEREIQGRRILSQLFGITAYPQGKKAVDSELRRRLEVVNAWIRSQRDQGVKIPSTTPTGSGSGNPFG